MIADASPGGAIRAYVNETGVTVPAGSVALDAVRALFPELAAAIHAGQMRLTDSRGLPIDAHDPLVSGAIYRVLPMRERLDTAPDTIKASS